MTNDSTPRFSSESKPGETSVAATERAAVYDLLARFWASEIDEPLWNALSTGELRAAYHNVGGQTPSDETLDELQVDYCQLFLGPKGHMPPVQSVWEQNRFEGNAAASVRQYLEILGIQAPLGERLPPDHAANCLAMYGYLCTQIGIQNESQSNEELADLAGALFLGHVRWIIELAEAAKERASTHFYRGVMEITRQFLNDEFATMAGRELSNWEKHFAHRI